LVFVTNIVLQAVRSRNKWTGDSKAKLETDAMGCEKFKSQEGEIWGMVLP
jgi:hypothetical protein